MQPKLQLHNEIGDAKQSGISGWLYKRGWCTVDDNTALMKIFHCRNIKLALIFTLLVTTVP